jgi:hypothetical protein
VVDFQIFKDMMDILGDTKGAEFNQVVHIAKSYVQPTLMGFEDTSSKLSDASWIRTPDHITELRADCGKMVYQALEKPFGGIEANGTKEPDLGCSALAPLFLRLPMLCGWLAATLLKFKLVEGVFACNGGRIVLAVAHLYTACRDYGLLKGRWEDMEFFISSQGADKLRLWSPGAGLHTLRAAARHYDIALGADPRQYASARRRKLTEKAFQICQMPVVERLSI